MRTTALRFPHLTGVVLLVILIGLASPASVIAQEQTASGSEVLAVNSTDAVTVMLQSLQGVELGSSGATLTLDLEGQQSEVPIAYADTAALGGADQGLLPLLTLGVGMGILGRVVRRFARLASRLHR